MRLILPLVMILFCFVASAQSKKQSKEETPAEAFYPQAEQTPKKKSGGTTYDARDKSFARLENNWKLRQRNSRNPDRDYSIAPYFGHKRPPKIRPAGKRKVCNVCGVTH